jgi:hypothetical protein
VKANADGTRGPRADALIANARIRRVTGREHRALRAAGQSSRSIRLQRLPDPTALLMAHLVGYLAKSQTHRDPGAAFVRVWAISGCPTREGRKRTHQTALALPIEKLVSSFPRT